MGNQINFTIGGNLKMNIKEAKQQISNAMKAYFAKDDSGNYLIPTERQRPVFLMGPPGIGKTAIMEQIASEMGVGILSYSMTHHTRQSALGLPFIEHKNYNGVEYAISEYTMSEIIASVYDLMEETGVKEGILFLDEINCVSETLAPVMLQFLQYKVFGRHTVPDGWIVVTAGNPPEYNNSVREFDIVTWDRLKRIDVEAEFNVWKEYAYNTGVHPSVISYLEIKKGDFYSIETTVEGKSFVTARGWDDLSRIIKVYEKLGIAVDNALVNQYIQNRKIAKSFANYYDLFKKYKSDYQVDTILNGTASAEIKDRARSAKFDERLSLLSLMIDAILNNIKHTLLTRDITKEMQSILKQYQTKLGVTKKSPSDCLAGFSAEKQRTVTAGKKSGSMSKYDISVANGVIACLDDYAKKIASETDGTKAFALIKKDFNKKVKDFKKLAETTSVQIDNMFIFADEVFSAGQEMLILVTELTANNNSASFISRFGSKEYFKYSSELMFSERQSELLREIDDLKLDDFKLD